MCVLNDYANFNGNAVYYRGRNNSSADYGLFYLNNNNASNANANIGSRILSKKNDSSTTHILATWQKTIS